MRLKTTTTIQHSGRITADDIRKAFSLPDEATVSFTVPGGGDWSNTSIDISEEQTLCVSWQETRISDMGISRDDDGDYQEEAQERHRQAMRIPRNPDRVYIKAVLPEGRVILSNGAELRGIISSNFSMAGAGEPGIVQLKAFVGKEEG